MAKAEQRSSRVGKKRAEKPLLKAKLKQKSKNAKAHIEKLNRDMTSVTSIHSELAKKEQKRKEVNALDAKVLREDLKRDEKEAEASKLAESDLQSQLEMITGMGL